MSLRDVIRDYKPDNSKKVNAFGVYHPWRGGTNPNFDSFSSDILKIKNMDIGMIQIASEEINKRIKIDDIAIAVVPSHDPQKNNSGIKMIAKLLCSNTMRVDAIHCLVRHKKIDKVALGGNRNKEVHLSSIKVIDKHLIAGKLVLLLDDVTTTNNSMLACKELLLKNGARQVLSVALAQTA